MINQTALFFAAARAHSEDSEAMDLCKMLLEAGVPLHHKDAPRAQPKDIDTVCELSCELYKE